MTGNLESIGGWARSSKVLAYVATPRGTTEVDALFDRPGSRGLIPRGAGHSYGDAAQRAAGSVLRTSALDRVLAFDSATGEATVEAGIELGQLMRRTVPEGWLPPVLPSTSRVTVGGAIAADIHARNQQRDGSFADHVSAIRLRTPAGPVDASPDEHPDLFWATAGGMGLTGLILDATVRLTRIESASMHVTERRAGDLDEVMALMETAGDAHRYSSAWIDCLAGTRGRGVVVCGDHAKEGGLDYAPRRGLRLPHELPRLLYATPMRAFNELVFRRAPADWRERRQSLHGFFFMHDWVGNWLQVCGPGFVEYQFVVPPGRDDVIRTAIERVVAARAQPLFAVLKRMRAQNPGPLSFPMDGWEFALDMPFRPGMTELLDGLDELVAEAGGRIYLAKDARLRATTLAAMYPRLGEWRTARERYDPQGVMRSDLAARLELT